MKALPKSSRRQTRLTFTTALDKTVTNTRLVLEQVGLTADPYNTLTLPCERVMSDRRFRRNASGDIFQYFHIFVVRRVYQARSSPSSALTTA